MTGSDPIAMRDHALEAAMTAIMSKLTFIVPGEANRLARWVGSSSVVRTPRGRLLILTAKHNFEDNDPLYSMGWVNCRGGLNDAISQDRFDAPHPIDVAVAVPKPHAAPHLEQVAIDYSQVANQADDKIGSNQGAFIAGVPSNTVLFGESNRGDRALLFGGVVYGCPVEGRDPKGRYMVCWKAGIVCVANNPWSQMAGVNLGDEEILPPAPGMSGGPLWRLETVPEDSQQLWSPMARGRLIGVQSVWNENDRTLYVESVATWGEWFAEVVRAVDSKGDR